MYMRKIMVGKMFAGGRVSSFHLTLLARHSVRRPRPLRENSEVICESRGSPQLTRWGATLRRHLLPAPTGSADSSGRSTLKYFSEVGLSRPVNPHQVREPLELPRSAALLLFPTCGGRGI